MKVLAGLNQSRPMAAAFVAVLLCALSLALSGCENVLAIEAAALQAKAVSPIISLSLADSTALSDNDSLSFGVVSVGSRSDITITIKNTGVNDLVIDVDKIKVTPDSSTKTGDFSLSAPPPAKIVATGSSSFTIRFTPDSEGAKTATVAIPTNDVQTPSCSFDLTGKGWGVVLTTNTVTGIAQTTATGGGNITNDGGESITERGICWGTSQNPTTIDSKASDGGTGTGAYSCLMPSLTPGALYYVRAYANNGITTGYGSQVSFSTLPATPSAPSVAPVSGTEGSRKLTVIWTAVSGASIYYDVYYSTGSTQPSLPNGPINLATTSCTLSGLINYTNYNVWIVAKNATGSSVSPSSSSMVGVKVEAITLNKTPKAFLFGSSETLIATCSPATATLKSVSWSTSNSSYATVINGTVAVGSTAGSVTIIATAADGQLATVSLIAPVKAFSANTVGPAGGYLFYDSLSYGAKGWRYMEAASVNVGGGNPWGLSSADVIGAEGTDYGTGATNTAALIAQYGSGTYMAVDCDSYSQDGYSDWFMPSYNEANLMQSLVTSVLASSPFYIVSSSEYYSTGCWVYRRINNDWYGISKTYKDGSVVTRPVRQF